MFFLSVYQHSEDFYNDVPPIRRIRIYKEFFTIGRGENCDIVLKKPNISRLHCTLVFLKSSEHHRLIDGAIAGKMSSNGIFLIERENFSDPVRVYSHSLKDGDIFSFGSFYFLYRIDMGKVASEDSPDKATIS